MSKYKADIKYKYQFDLFDWFCTEKGKKEIKLMNKKLQQLQCEFGSVCERQAQNYRDYWDNALDANAVFYILLRTSITNQLFEIMTFN